MKVNIKTEYKKSVTNRIHNLENNYILPVRAEKWDE